MTKRAGSSLPAYVLFSDGSAKGRDLGWGVVLWRAGSPQAATLSGGIHLASTLTAYSEIAEWRAAAAALEMLGPKKRTVWLLTDCMSVAAFLDGLAREDLKAVDVYIGRVGAKLVFQLAQLAMAVPNLRTLKVKGHAGSHGNTVVDKLAGTGREEQHLRKGILPLGQTFEAELEVLLQTSSVAYSFEVPAGTPNLHEEAKAAKRLGKRVLKVSGERISELTRGMRFELSGLESKALAAQAAAIRARADKMPKSTPGQRRARAVALLRAGAYVAAAGKKLLREKRKEAALRLANAERAGTID